MVTLGNHVGRAAGRPLPWTAERVLRRANLATGTPGRGLAVVDAEDGRGGGDQPAGRALLRTPVSPFDVVDELVDEAHGAAKVMLVDFHAEATSEKVALSRELDCRVTAVPERTPTSRRTTRACSPAAVPPASTRASFVWTWVCVPSTAVTRPSR